MRSFDKALGLSFPKLPAACATCGAPNFGLGLVIVLEPDDEIRSCAGCGGAVTASGIPLTPIVPTDHFKVIYLEHDPPESADVLRT